MERSTPILDVDIVRAESPKFRRPLLLLHGLWTGGWLWRPLTSYFAHRGWESWIARALEPRRADVATLEAAADALARRCPAVPVVIAHGSAALLATRLAARIDAPALVMIAPVVPPAESAALGSIFRWPQYWRSRFGGAVVAPPRGRKRSGFAGGGSATAAPLVSDSGRLFRELAGRAERFPRPAATTGLVISAERDAVSPASAGAEWAARHGWQHVVYAGRGHLVVVEPGWERLADDVHRWLVRALGADLLAFLDDDEAGDE